MITAIEKAIKKANAPDCFNERFESVDPGYIQETKDDLVQLLAWAESNSGVLNP